jgi:2'-hydroxyisoflavone reductase
VTRIPRTTRRHLLQTAAGAAASSALGTSRLFGGTEPKTLLILGGTRFLGPELVEAAKKTGWKISLFNRGKSNPGLFPELEHLQGDRDGDLKSLEGRSWDAVVDTSGYVPRMVKDSATLLAPHVRQYVFVSSISVFSDLSKAGVDETGPVETLADPAVEKVDEKTYGGLKALCEKAAETAMPGRVTNVRPGLIVGPNDNTDRFTYWPVRVARGGDVLAPNRPEDAVQFIDVRDLAAWIVKCIDTKTVGVFNATGNPGPVGTLLDTCKAASGSDAKFTWVDAPFLEAQKVAAWSDLPCWIPPTGSEAGGNKVSNARAVGKGLAFRPLRDTCKDTLAWWKAQPAERQARLRSGLSAEREAAVLAAWREAQAKKVPKAG